MKLWRSRFINPRFAVVIRDIFKLFWQLNTFRLTHQGLIFLSAPKHSWMYHEINEDTYVILAKYEFIISRDNSSRYASACDVMRHICICWLRKSLTQVSTRKIEMCSPSGALESREASTKMECTHKSRDLSPNNRLSILFSGRSTLVCVYLAEN